MSSTGVSFDPRVVLRPRTADETFDLALVYVRVCFKDLAPLLFGVPLSCLAVTGLVWLGLSSAGPSFNTPASWGKLSCAALLMLPTFERVVTVYTGRHLFRNEASVRAACATVLARLPITGAWTIFATAPLLLALWGDFDEPLYVTAAVLLGSFWPFLVASHLYLGEVAHLEQLRAREALGRTRLLVAHRFGRALAVLLLGAIVRALSALTSFLGLSFLLEFVLQIEGASSLSGGWAALAGYFAAGPYLAIVRLFDYVDARTRREGWDIQVRFNAVAQRAKEEEARRAA